MYALLQRDFTQILLMGALLVLSGGFSGSETALFSLKAADLNRFRRQGGAVARAIEALHADLGEFLMTVLFCNMVVNILFFATSTVIAADIARAFGPEWAVPFGLGCLVLVILLGEVTPKTVAAAAAPFFSRLAALPMFALHRAFRWVRVLLGGVVRGLERAAGITPVSATVSPGELRLLVRMSRADGVISSDEHGLIGEVLELPDIRVREMMTPRVDAVTILDNATVGELLQTARDRGHSKLPVRNAATDEFTGWIDAREAFLRAASETDPIAPFARAPLFVSELDRADQVLARMQAERCRLAIVVDERGATEGLLTPADVAAEIIGEIGDEDAPPEEAVREDGENAYLVSGGVSVRDWRNLFGVAMPLPRAATLGGLATALLGRPPRRGDAVNLGNVRMEVCATAKRRVRSLRVTLAPESETEVDR